MLMRDKPTDLNESLNIVWKAANDVKDYLKFNYI